MNPAQGAAATGESEETTPNAAETAAATATQTETEPSSTLGAVLRSFSDLPEDVIKKAEARGQTTPTAAEEEAGTAAEGEEEEDQTPNAERTTSNVEHGKQQQPLPDEWPPSAKARVADEAEKRRKATIRATNAEGRVTELESELQEARGQTQPVIAPSPQDPLADVMDGQGLRRAEAQYEELLAFAEDNPDGAENVLVGKTPGGEEIRKDYTVDDIRLMKRTAEKILRKAIPAKAEWLQSAASFSKQATQVYPEMFEDGSEAGKEAAVILTQLPEIRRFPDFLVWIGDAIAGRNARMAKANGQRKVAPGGKALSKAAEAILGQPKVTLAPAASKSRTAEQPAGAGGEGVDRKQAQETFVESGGSEQELEKLVTNLRTGQRTRSGTAEKALV